MHMHKLTHGHARRDIHALLARRRAHVCHPHVHVFISCVAHDPGLAASLELWDESYAQTVKQKLRITMVSMRCCCVGHYHDAATSEVR